MFSLRWATLAATAAAVVGGSLGEAGGQTADVRATAAIAEMARAIAGGISSGTVKTPGAAIAFQSATSHDNVVELRYLANDAAGFARLKASAEQARVAKVSYYCQAGRFSYLKQGVVFHEVIATSTGGEQLDFIFDKASCASLPKPALADSKTLAGLAITVAKAENAAAQSEASGKPAPFHPSQATAHQGIVDERFTVRDASAKAITPANRGKIAALVTEYFCIKYRDVISQGLAFHHVFVSTGNTPVIDFTINRTSC